MKSFYRQKGVGTRKLDYTKSELFFLQVFFLGWGSGVYPGR